MNFESCFGGVAASKSAPATMGGEPTFAEAMVNGGVAPIQTFPAPCTRHCDRR